MDGKIITSEKLADIVADLNAGRIPGNWIRLIDDWRAMRKVILKFKEAFSGPFDEENAIQVKGLALQMMVGNAIESAKEVLGEPTAEELSRRTSGSETT